MFPFVHSWKCSIFFETLPWKILSCFFYPLIPPSNIITQLHNIRPILGREHYSWNILPILRINRGLLEPGKWHWQWLLKHRSDYFQSFKKNFLLDKGRFSFKPYLLCKHDKRLNGWECTEAVQIHPLTSELNWLSCTNLIFARKFHFSIPQRRKLMRLNELRNYFLNDFSQVMYSKSRSFLFNAYFLGAIWGPRTNQRTFLL